MASSMSTLGWAVAFEFHCDLYLQTMFDEPYFALIVSHLKLRSQMPFAHGHDSYAVVIAVAVDVGEVVTADADAADVVVVAAVCEIHVS